MMHIYHYTAPQPYEPIYVAMRDYTQQRTPDSADEIWFLEHIPVFTQGQAGKPQHILDPGAIPIVHSDRGGQVTYHGPGQLMIYTLFNLKRHDMGIKEFVHHLQNSILRLLHAYEIKAHTLCHAPGVYVDGAKICSLGLRIRKGCTYHGISLNINMDLSPFRRINPCGISQLPMTQLCDFIPHIALTEVKRQLLSLLIPHNDFVEHFDYDHSR